MKHNITQHQIPAHHQLYKPSKHSKSLTAPLETNFDQPTPQAQIFLPVTNPQPCNRAASVLEIKSNAFSSQPDLDTIYKAEIPLITSPSKPRPSSYCPKKKNVCFFIPEQDIKQKKKQKSFFK